MIEQKNLKFIGLFCLLLPFMQVGYTYYLSVQLLLVMILLMNCSHREVKVLFLLTLFLSPIMVFPAIIASQGEWGHTFLLSFRECSILALIMAIGIESRTYQGMNKEYIKYLLLFFLGVIFLQFIALRSGGIILSLPSEIIIANKGALEGFEFALSMGIYDLVRPSVFYGEPSFLSFVCVSLLYIVLVNKAFSNTEKKYYAAIVLLTFLFSQSMSGILALFILFGASLLKNIKIKDVLLILLGMILLISILISFSDSIVVQRLLAIMSFDGSDSSSMTRLVEPFTLISSVFQDYPFGGVSRDLLEAVYGVDGIVHGVDNGLLNVFITYGYFGFVIWGIIVAIFFRSPMALLYVVLAAMFNGAFLSIDKLSVIGMTIILANSNISQLKFREVKKRSNLSDAKLSI